MGDYATVDQAWAAALIFLRLGALVMLIPGVGEQVVPPRIRLAFAFLFTLAVYPVLAPGLPSVPATVGAMAGLAIKELLIGLMIGAILRLFLASLTTAGEIISLQSTLGFSQTANPGQAQPTTSLATFLSVMGVVLIMATDLHHLFLAAVVRSYDVFPLTRDVPVGDAAQLAVQTVARSFALGLQLSAPVLVFALVVNVATGLIGRVMPQFQIFFVASPILVIGALSIFALGLGVLGMVWLDRYRDLLAVFI